MVPSNVLNWFEGRKHALDRRALHDGNGTKDRNPERDDVGKVGVESCDIEADDHRARDDRNAHLAHDVSHRPAVRSEIAPSRCRDSADRAPRDDRRGKQKPCSNDSAPFCIERENDARRHQRDQNETADEPPDRAMPRRAPLNPARHEQEAKRERKQRARDVNAQRCEPERLEAHGKLLER
jgi:hypothetical protein